MTLNNELLLNNKLNLDEIDTQAFSSFGKVVTNKDGIQIVGLEDVMVGETITTGENLVEMVMNIGNGGVKAIVLAQEQKDSISAETEHSLTGDLISNLAKKYYEGARFKGFIHYQKGRIVFIYDLHEILDVGQLLEIEDSAKGSAVVISTIGKKAVAILSTKTHLPSFLGKGVDIKSYGPIEYKLSNKNPHVLKMAVSPQIESFTFLMCLDLGLPYQINTMTREIRGPFI